MKIGMISDLHIDINEDYPVLELTAEAAKAQDVDALVIAGDISETPDQTLRAIDKLQGLCSMPVYYVPGNHDMWNKNCPGRSTEEIDRVYREDARCLSGKHILLEKDGQKLALTGDIGWYDYTMASPEYTEEQLNVMTMDGRTWQDKLFNQWTEDNRKQMERRLGMLEEQLEFCGEIPILAVTHMLPIKDFCVQETPGGLKWGFFNAFLGSTAIEALYRRHSVKYAVCGHVHFRSQVERNGIRYICPCLGYHTEWPLYQLGDDSAETHIKDALYVLEVESFGEYE